jgi:hypothetical protein
MTTIEDLISNIKHEDTIEYYRNLLDTHEKKLSFDRVSKSTSSTIWLEIPKFTTDFYRINRYDYEKIINNETEWVCFADEISIKEKNKTEWVKIDIIYYFKKLGYFCNQDHHHLWRRNSEMYN